MVNVRTQLTIEKDIKTQLHRRDPVALLHVVALRSERWSFKFIDLLIAKQPALRACKRFN
jgi:hypothetical protein